MTIISFDDASKIIYAAMGRKRLKDLEQKVLLYSWEGKTYEEIAELCGYDPSYVRDVGYRLWNLLSTTFGEKITKKNLQVVISANAKHFHLPEPEINHEVTDRAVATHNAREVFNFVNAGVSSEQGFCDWGNAIDTSVFYGRTQDLEIAENLIVHSHCRLLNVIGMGGIGKTTFVAKLAEQVQPNFQRIIWRSLAHTPKLEVLLAELISFFTNQAIANIPQDLDQLFGLLIQCLKQWRCLIVFDDVEAVLGNGETSQYLEGYEGYGELFRQFAQIRHQSCLVLTSREQPADVLPTQIGNPIVQSLRLTGLGESARQLFGKDLENSDEVTQLIEFYSGNPQALSTVANLIQNGFDGDIQEFCLQDAMVFGNIRSLMTQQYVRLSPLEKQIMCWIAIERGATTATRLWHDIVPMILRSQILEATMSLHGRSLIDKDGITFKQQPLVMEYMTCHLVDMAFAAITQHQPDFLISYALVQQRADDYTRAEQISQILEPLTERLAAHYGTAAALQDALNQLWTALCDRKTAIGYAQSNIHQIWKASQSAYDKSLNRFDEPMDRDPRLTM
ncbi:NB-ARC domain-containing protein [Pseudanabaena mucicola]|uniref:NB-ARC domain-containing protein n=1 Tax=Pseudanabaena mucicola FACHB-723 TaxID=2692860 RepID=A0ABR7ZZ35_9CYAN|nr:NB-ARC domain-containing protein [Pseudanabaena mucicola]MBD2188780.1 hypothetical protein [Pseudanabaena mucicola FACHB-723]